MNNPLIKFASEALGLAVLAILWYALGHHYGFQAAKHAGELEMAAYKGGLASASAQQMSNAMQKFGQRVAFGNLLTSQLVAQERSHAQTAADLHAQVPHVTTVYRPAQAAQPAPIPACVFTRGWLHRYNAAIGAAVPAAAETTSLSPQASDAAAAAEGDDLAPAGIDPAGILNHHIDYGARARDLEAQLNGLIDYEEGADVQQ
ncbi:hypothetical protein [Ralstonia mannitolilytica]|uniref:hypothetical protein n=1 Tax=Ralstonia mannitolilytica TaxID=105219 RepID=UPI000CEE53F9|nr:hypothetical protein [Ralstonia mannitolilytica]